MSQNLEETDPGLSAKAHKAALKAQEAARKADPYADRLTARVTASPMTAVILLVSHGIAFGLGVWAAW